MVRKEDADAPEPSLERLERETETESPGKAGIRLDAGEHAGKRAIDQTRKRGLPGHDVHRNHRVEPRRRSKQIGPGSGGGLREAEAHDVGHRGRGWHAASNPADLAAEIEVREILTDLFEGLHPLPRDIGNGIERGFIIRHDGCGHEKNDGEESEIGHGVAQAQSRPQARTQACENDEILQMSFRWLPIARNCRGFIWRWCLRDDQAPSRMLPRLGADQGKRDWISQGKRV